MCLYYIYVNITEAWNLYTSYYYTFTTRSIKIAVVRYLIVNYNATKKKFISFLDGQDCCYLYGSSRTTF